VRSSRRTIFHDADLQKLADIRETKELEERATRERAGLPTTIEGFKHHVEFVLKRHIGKYQVLAPGSQPVGMHKGEPYYLKSNLSEVHTAERWKRVGREVKPEELRRPVKQIKKRGAKLTETQLPYGEIEEEDQLSLPESLMSNFYGEWQTKPWRPPAASNGKVPKNERGNVEVPPFVEELPRGTVS
jgi:xeroderma pigmentosum group C-complementing protein